MKWSELRRIAEKKGWILHRHGSRHDIYKKKDGIEMIAIGRHDKEEIPKGTFSTLRKQIGF